jgi:hypothetical protein
MMAALMPCGTVAAYKRHLRYHQVPCQPCADANARREAARRRGVEEQAALLRELLDLLTAECRRTGMLP